MKKYLSFITRLDKKLQVTVLSAKLSTDAEKPFFMLSIEVTPSAFFLIERFSWFNLHPVSKGTGHHLIDRQQAVILDLNLNKEILELVMKELHEGMDLLKYLNEQSKNSALLQTENWITWQIRQILSAINAKGETVLMENKYPTLWAESEPYLSDDTNISHQLEILLQYLKWDYKTESNGSYLIDYYGKNGAWQCRISADNSQNSYRFVSILPIKVPEERHFDMIQYLTKINQEASIAHFSFNTHSGKVVCKSAELVKRGAKLAQKRLVALAEVNTEMMDKHIVKLLEISNIDVEQGFIGFRKKVTF